MANASDYLEKKVLDHVLANVAYTSPTTIYMALFDGDPTDAGTGGTEVTLTIDATGRKATSFGACTATTGISTIDADVDFGLADAGADVTHFAIYDAATAGNLLVFGALNGGSQTISTGNAVKFASGDLTVTLA